MNTDQALKIRAASVPKLDAATKATNIKLEAFKTDLDRLERAINNLGARIGKADMSKISDIRQQVAEAGKDLRKLQTENAAQLAYYSKLNQDKEAQVKKLEQQIIELSADFEKKSADVKRYFTDRQQVVGKSLSSAEDALSKLRNEVQRAIDLEPAARRVAKTATEAKA